MIRAQLSLQDLPLYIFASGPERLKMLEELCELASSGSLKPPECETFTLQEFESALENSRTAFSRKSLIQFSRTEKWKNS